MSLSGRQQTLLSIYGAANDAKRRCVKKPQRPLSTPLMAALLPRKRSLRPVPSGRSDSEEWRTGATQEDEDTGRNNEQAPATLSAPSPPLREARSSAEGQTAMPQETTTPRIVKRKTHIRDDRGGMKCPSTATAATSSGGSVISLYGDGFLEIPMSGEASNEPESAESPRLLASAGFVVSLLLFKAADTEKHKVKVDADGARHKTPDLDDTGEFVRWLCCGSTNRSIFGCSASRDEENVPTRKRGGRASIFQASSESTPKLLSAKLHAESSGDEETTFSIYDRGVLPPYRDRGEDGGCRVRWRGWECWANNYEVPSNRWVHLRVVFDCRFVQVFFDDELVDCARIQRVEPSEAPSSPSPRGRRAGGSSAWVQAPSSSNSIYVGGHPSYARSVRDWRARIGFVGLIASFKLWKRANDQQQVGRKATASQGDALVSLTIPDVGSVKDSSSFGNVVNAHRNVFWRLHAPPIWTPTPPGSCGPASMTKGAIVLLANFFDGAHHDVGVSSPKSFENLLLSAVQCGDMRVLIEYAAEFSVQRSHDHVCRSQVEYEQKASAVVAGIEQMSPLLNVVANAEGDRPPIGSFEVTMELTRAAGRAAVAVVLHSMSATGCFPNVEELKRKIESIVLFEAKRSPGEEIQIQAFRHLLALAGQTRHNRERTFMESVINRKLVLTERKVAAEFEKIGFFFAPTELQEVVSSLKRIQDKYSRAQDHRMDDLPSLSMLTPSSTGLYTLPFMTTLMVSSTVACETGGARSPWRFVCVLVDHDFQLVDFVHEGCPVTRRGGVSYRQRQSTYNGIVDRVHLRLPALTHKVFCVLFSLQKLSDDENDPSDPHVAEARQAPIQPPGVRVQLENVEERHVLGMFDAKPKAGCRWFTLAAAFRAKKNNQWQLQAIGGCGSASSIYASIDEVNVLLAELRIIQTYEIRVHFVATSSETDSPDAETRQCQEFTRRLAKNIRFGRNGRIVLVPVAASDDGSSKLRIALKLQEEDAEIDVYTHRSAANRSLPTIQSVYRTLLRLLAQHGIKECLQQNPFAPQNKRVKRHVEFRVVSAQTNAPIDKVHVFLEKNVTLDGLSSNLAKTVLPTLMMGSRLMSIRRRLQKKRAAEITREVAQAFVSECIAKASKRATLAASLNVKLISVIRARALLRRVMKLRYDKIKACIVERARKSDHAREYSQSVPLRLQRLCTQAFELSGSERDLLQHSTRGELAELDLAMRGLAVPFKDKPLTDERALLEEWRSKKAQFALEEQPEKESPALEATAASLQERGEDQQDEQPEEPPDGGVKDRRQLFVTDSDGRTSCRLIPGSYSLYVFHLDFFEWTSLAAVYPTVTAAGLFSGPTAASASVQEMVIPLDVYRWTYSLQLVDYFHPHVNIKLAGIPLQVTNNCSSERQVVVTDATGCATWDVSKGLYAVDVLRECSCVLYSALKQVVVDGGRYRTSKTIAMPVLFGGVKVTVLVAAAAPVTASKSSELASIRFHADSAVGSRESAAAGKRRNARMPRCCDSTTKDEPSDGEVAVGGSRAFKLRLGAYSLEVSLAGCFPVSLPVGISWASSRTQAKDGNRYLAVLSPAISMDGAFRVVLSYVDDVEAMDLILEVWKESTLIGSAWRQTADSCAGHVQLEAVNSIDGCEYQSLLLQCQAGFTYKCLVASNLSMAHCLRPYVQIYSSAGLLYQCSEPPSIGELYWHICSWDAAAVLAPATSLELPPSADAASV